MVSRFAVFVVAMSWLIPAGSAHAIFTDGFEARPPAILVINEIESQGDALDYVEFYNPTALSIDLSGWSFTDNTAGHVFTFANGSMVPAGGYLVIEPSSFALGSNDSVSLLSPSQQLIDFYAWTVHANGTFGRCPDGTGAFTDLVPTRGLPNCP